MNFLFLTQNKTLELFYEVSRALEKKSELKKVGFYLADSTFYDTFKRQRPEITSGSFELLKEWEIIEKSRHIRPDIRILREYEGKLGDPVLWNALVADRRIYLGKRATLEQDYPSRFGHERMLALIQTGLEEMAGMFDRVQPDAVVGFICVTIGEYLAYLMANSRGIPFLNLRPTRIKNYFYAGESVHEPSKRLEEAYQEALTNGVPKDVERQVCSYLTEVRETHAMYEGVLPTSRDTPPKKWNEVLGEVVSIVLGLGATTKKYYEYNFGKYKHDNHYPGSYYRLWFKKFKRPARIKYNDYYLRKHYISTHDLTSMDYLFYPLHKEPEVTLLVYSRPYMNQMEVVRNLARSLPVGMKVIVKEHPASVGYRPLSYYKKLLSIPNVLIAFPHITSRALVQSAKLVAIISGSIGLEAIMLKKPVIHFGNIPFSIISDRMIRHIKQPDNLGWIINELLESHYHEEEALIAYLAAVMQNSVAVDFYTVLLGRKGAYKPDLNSWCNATDYTRQIERLALYLTQRLKMLQD